MCIDGASRPWLHTHLALREIVCFNSGGFDLWHPKYMYGYLKEWYNPKPLWIRLMPSYFIWDSAYLVWAQLHLKYFCNVCMLGHFMSILFFPAPPHPQYGKCSKYCWYILTICICGRYLGVETMFQLLFLMLWQPILYIFLDGTFGHGNMTCWPKCNVCVLEARIR